MLLVRTQNGRLEAHEITQRKKRGGGGFHKGMRKRGRGVQIDRRREREKER